jgi:uncharacterized protein (UPF0261 family)
MKLRSVGAAENRHYTAGMPTVLLIGTLDTKGLEYAYLKKRLKALGCDVILMDTGVLGAPGMSLQRGDVRRDAVAAAAGAPLEALVRTGDRGAAVMAMARGAAAITLRLFGEGRVQGVLSVGGSGNASIAAEAMRALPIGVPKLLVTTLAAGDTRPFVGTTDITMMYPVVDIAGLNRISERILSNAAAGIAGMAADYAKRRRAAPGKPLIGVTMFGVTTPCVTVARAWLEKRGYELLVFHATGSGGRSMEALIAGGFLSGVLDATTTEWADELVGGVLAAGPTRLDAAAHSGTPQVVSFGALDMVNFGPLDSVPAQFRARKLYQHNAAVTLMRTTPGECAALGRKLAEKLNAAHGPLAVFVPQRGVSSLSVTGAPFFDPVADRALFESFQAAVRADIAVYVYQTDINDALFAKAMAVQLDKLIKSARR